MTLADRITERLSGVRQVREGQFRAKCPAHDGKSARSLSILHTGNRILLHCFAGCPTRAVVRALGMASLRSLFEDSRLPCSPDPDSERRKRAHRGLQIWCEERLTYVCMHLRDLDSTIHLYASSPHLHDDPELSAYAFSLVAERDALEKEFEILNRRDLREKLRLWQRVGR